MKNNVRKKVIVIGAGAAGFFGALNIAFSGNFQVTILEKGNQVLSKVKISGGGRCNVTNACADPFLLARNYPRGSEFLAGLFMRFNPSHIIKWFAERDVKLKTEPDGRMFPVTDSSQTIIDCFLEEAKKFGVNILLQTGVQTILHDENKWIVKTAELNFEADYILFTAGSSNQAWDLLNKKGLEIEPPVPSLFTFNISDPRIKNLQGLSVKTGSCKILSSDFSAEGPVLITHWGLSGPGILRLSAWGAKFLHEKNYEFMIQVNWTEYEPEEVLKKLKKTRDTEGKKLCGSFSLFDMPVRLWKSFTDHLQLTHIKWASLSNKQIIDLSEQLSKCEFNVKGKSTFKDEFVTCGGVKLSEIDPETMECRKLPGLFFAGEIINIDAITGGFNFQAAWTTSWIAAQKIINY